MIRPRQPSLDRIVVLMPTRKRPDLVRRSIESFEASTEDRERTEIWVMVDDDDALTLDFIRSGWTSRLKVEWSVGPRPACLSAGINDLWKASTLADIYVHVPDDHFVETPAWDTAVRRTFAQGPADRLVVAQIEVAERPDELLCWASSAEWTRITGRFMPPYFPFWFTDLWTNYVSAMAGRQARSGVVVRPIEPDAQPTTAMWNLPFWMRFFHTLHEERVAEAEAILVAIHGSNAAAYAEARADMDARALQCESITAGLLDDEKLRVIERRYSNGRSEPDDRALRAEAAARTHLQQRRGGG
jgi:hypothetical protein